MNGFSYLLLVIAFWFVGRAIFNGYQRSDARRYRSDEIERTRLILERDPNNSGTRAKLAAFLIEDGDLDAGIHEYRAAIATTPHGPFATTWKNKLRDAIDIQQRLARGERIPGFHDWRVCPNCQATVPVGTQLCPRCGTTLHVPFVQWFADINTHIAIWREGLPIAVVLIVVVVLISSMEPLLKATVICSTAMVSAWYFLRSIGGT